MQLCNIPVAFFLIATLCLIMWIYSSHLWFFFLIIEVLCFTLWSCILQLQLSHNSDYFLYLWLYIVHMRLHISQLWPLYFAMWQYFSYLWPKTWNCDLYLTVWLHLAVLSFIFTTLFLISLYISQCTFIFCKLNFKFPNFNFIFHRAT